MSTESKNPRPKLSIRFGVSASWLFIPLVSAIAFFTLFYNFATHIELSEFNWSVVISNTSANTTNAPTAFSSRGQSQPPAENAKTAGGTTNVTRDGDRVIKELSVRMYWAIAAIGLIFLSFSLVIYSMQIISGIVTPPKNSAFFAYFGLGLFAALWFAALFYLSEGKTTAIAGGQAAEQLLQLVENSKSSEGRQLNASLRASPMPNLRDVRPLLALASASTELGVLFVAIAAGFALGAMRVDQDRFEGLSQPTPQDAESAKFKYESRVRTTIALLQFTACTLVAGVIAVYLFYNLASYYIDKRLQGNVQTYAQSMAIVFGLVYSAALIAIFLPLVAGQRLIGKELLASHGGKVVNGQGTTFVAQLDDVDPKKTPMVAAILTVLSPVLVAFLTKLASSMLNL